MSVHHEPSRLDRVARGGRENIVDRALGDFDAPVHEQFAEGKFGIKQETNLSGEVIEPQAKRFAAAVADLEFLSGRGFDVDLALLDEGGQKGAKHDRISALIVKLRFKTALPFVGFFRIENARFSLGKR
jgi:hypothetical protein